MHASLGEPFALSCFVVLDCTSGRRSAARSPLAAKGYQFQVDFKEATQLADTADVRISGVTVGQA